MFAKSAELYDTIYASLRDAEREAARIDQLIREHGRGGGNRLLDVACGTGALIPYLRDRYRIEGLDLEPAMIEIARRKHPGIPFHLADMADFELGRQFDAVICVFSSIGYVKTNERLRQTADNFARHTAPGGVLIVEPWITPDRWIEGYLSAVFVDQPELKIARMSVSQARGDLSILDFNYLVATPNGVEHFVERHELGLFTNDEYRDAFAAAGFRVIHDLAGLIGRGLFIGVRQP